MPPKTIAVTAAPQARRLVPVAAEILSRHHLGAALSLRLQPDAQLGGEGYHLRIDGSGIAIDANAPAGIFYGLQTLDQLLPDGSDVREIAGVDVRDWPAYRWRGIHLDVSRHFFPVAVVERYIGVAAHYKLNVFHWHLTDDQGWRIQILRYPRLAGVGGCRAGTEMEGDATEIDAKRYCGYYTQAQIRAVVAYAAQRFVTVVPEIEMPGHSQAALAAYPQLACSPGPFRVRETWGVSDEILCPSEYTFSFLENVLREVMTLFPSPYIHVGGDEVPKDAWEHSAVVRALMRRKHIATYDGVQGYVDRRIEEFLAAHGRRMVGWDEILDGGVSKTAIVMSWRGEAGGIEAASRGNEAVMSPDGPLYFDAYQGDPNDEPLAIGNLSTPEDVYEYEPTPPSLTPPQAGEVIGVQGNLWTEYVATPSYLFYMLLPRMLSLGEIAWSDPHPRDWGAFEWRLGAQLPWLAEHGYAYRIPNPEFVVDGVSLRFANVSPSVRTVRATIDPGTVRVAIVTIVPGASIHYTTDGSLPTARSAVYAAPIPVSLAAGETSRIQAVAIQRDGESSTPSELSLGASSVRVSAGGSRRGVSRPG